jgi:hypothetical protein
MTRRLKLVYRDLFSLGRVFCGEEPGPLRALTGPPIKGKVCGGRTILSRVARAMKGTRLGRMVGR